MWYSTKLLLYEYHWDYYAQMWRRLGTATNLPEEALLGTVPLFHEKWSKETLSQDSSSWQSVASRIFSPDLTIPQNICCFLGQNIHGNRPSHNFDWEHKPVSSPMPELRVRQLGGKTKNCWWNLLLWCGQLVVRLWLDTNSKQGRGKRLLKKG